MSKHPARLVLPGVLIMFPSVEFLFCISTDSRYTAAPLDRIGL